MFGVKTESMKESGSIIKCTALVKFNGQMEEDIKASMKMIRSMDMVHFIGRMEEST